MGRPKKFENGFKVVKVYLQPEEYDRIFKKCGGGSVSDWARQAMLAELEGIQAVIGEYKDYGSANRVDQPAEDKPEKGRGVSRRRGRGDVLPATGKPKSCMHGINVGGTCTRCQNGRAVAP